MLESLITSKTRLKLLLKFFLNPDTKAYLRGLADEFGESTNAVRVELNRMAEAGLLDTTTDGRKKMYHANKKHSLFPDLNSIAKKYAGIDQLVDKVLKKLGNVELAMVTGDYARGIDSGIIDVVIVGDVDKLFLARLVEKAEKLTQRKIRTLVLTREDYERLKNRLDMEQALIVWDE